MPLQPPPATLVGFPTRGPATEQWTLYRIYRHRDPDDGHVNSPWRFSGTPPGRNRFDVATPYGTCYWSDQKYGAWLEVFRGATTVDLADARGRRLSTAHPPALRLADLLTKAAYRYGITAAVSTQPDYALPQQWAEALRGAGHQGLVGTCSHDPVSAALNVALFGRAGTPRSRPGWTTRASRIERDIELLAQLAAFGVRVAPVPYTVATVTPS